MPYIKEVKVENLWGYKNLLWDNVNSDVNILVGINGSGKSTILNILNSFLSNSKIKYENSACSILVENNTSNGKLLTEYISTFDTLPIKSSRSDSPLTLELLDTIYTTGKGSNSFYDYRLKATNIPSEADKINKRIQKLYSLIDRQFGLTGKCIGIDLETNKLIFKYQGKHLHLENLSSGEKQFLLIIFRIFLMEEQPYILLMDEPEISLHIDWQYELINIIRELNPNCQVIISTHSPSVFGDGWGDKVVYMEDILK